MTLVIGSVLFITGLIMIIKPKIFWQITEQWKSYDAEEPSDLYIKSAVFGGIIVILAGIGGVIVFFLR